MQTGRTATDSVKETAANVGASTKSVMDKTMAVLEEKVDILTAHDEVEKEIAELKKEEKLREAERSKHKAIHQNAGIVDTSKN